MEKKMQTSATKEFEKESLGEGSNGIVGKKPTTKRIILKWAYRIQLKI